MGGGLPKWKPDETNYIIASYNRSVSTLILSLSISNIGRNINKNAIRDMWNYVVVEFNGIHINLLFTFVTFPMYYKTLTSGFLACNNYTDQINYAPDLLSDLDENLIRSIVKNKDFDLEWINNYFFNNMNDRLFMMMTDNFVFEFMTMAAQVMKKEIDIDLPLEMMNAVCFPSEKDQSKWVVDGIIAKRRNMIRLG